MHCVSSHVICCGWVDHPVGSTGSGDDTPSPDTGGLAVSARSQMGDEPGETGVAIASQHRQCAWPLSVHGGPSFTATAVIVASPLAVELLVTFTPKLDHWHGGGPDGAVVVGVASGREGGVVADEVDWTETGVDVVDVGGAVVTVVVEEPAALVAGWTSACLAAAALREGPLVSATPAAETPTATTTAASTRLAFRSALGLTTILPTRSTPRIRTHRGQRKGPATYCRGVGYPTFGIAGGGQPIWSMAACRDCM